MDFLYNDLVNEDNRIFPEVKPIQLFKLPIKIASSETQNSISKLVDTITTSKKRGEETTEIEKELDKHVYNVYDLTEEEIAIIEKA